MRTITLSAAAALALAGRASTAVAAVPAGEGDGMVIERPTLAARHDIATTTSAALNGPTALTADSTIIAEENNISRLASIIASDAHKKACLSALTAGNHVPDCPTLFAPPRDAVATADLAPRATITTNIRAGDEEAARENAVATNMIATADPFGPLGSAIASYAHSIACSKIGLLNAWCDGTPSKLRRDALPDRRTTSWTTTKRTSTIAITTTTLLWTNGPHPLAPGREPHGHGISNPVNVQWHADPTSTTVTKPTGIAVIETTVTKLYTIHPVMVDPESTSECSTTSTSTTVPMTISTSSSSCNDNTSIDTQSYLNISTWSMTKCIGTACPSLTTTTQLPSTNMSSILPYFTEHSQSTAGAVTTHRTSTLAKTTATHNQGSQGLPGFGNPTTMTLGSSAGYNGAVDLSGIKVPIGMVAAMAGCFALALLL